MSRRAPAADTAERNRATLKQLVRLEHNKICADCKRNKHPRWASWNLGVFVCIRCSGIHRSLGVHISRVKSVDLDSWTDEQLASVTRWGNKRANKYWEHKLAPGHMPNEAKIENFIRTKYDSKRWVMDGPMPDPATLDDDDDVPLSVVQERARGNSLRNGSVASPPASAQPQVDLFGDPIASPPARSSTADPAQNRHGASKAPTAPPRQTKPAESLLGFDFLGRSQAGLSRPSSTGPGPQTAAGRSDLKQSILSLYASKPASTPRQASGDSQTSANQRHASPQSNLQALGGLDSAFSSLSFVPQQSTAKPAPFSDLSSHSRQASAHKPDSLSGGSFFDAKPIPKASPPRLNKRESFGDFNDFTSPPPSATIQPVSNPAPSISGTGGLLDLASSPPQKSPPLPKPSKAPPPINASNYYNATAFNLSSNTQQTTHKAAPSTQVNNASALNNMDAWGSSNAWATPDPASAPQTTAPSKPTSSVPKMDSLFDSGWGDTEPAVTPQKPVTSGFDPSAGGFGVQQDEEYGGWSHASPVASSTAPKPPALSSNTDDLFGNVWG
ncbi:ArfGap-domain-containing protein [Piedraia hortae CBS 480.64]|uniref:ArfGap-domain-containing protein n=1 Tax=Piedraia hortae CBS 480.64 TaxID=1314780 RepID=A0A6A7BVD1_9PEZI|nr:ArfGap-domain-containing protein [Piedraia hortae CBS 480.64]